MKKIYLVFLVLYVFTACEKEEIAIPLKLENESTNDKISVKFLNKDEIEGNKDILEQLKLFKTHNTRINRKEINNSDYRFTIDITKAKYFEKEDYHSYSFPIERSEGNENVENLLLSLNSNGGYNVYLVHYGFTKEELVGMSKGEISATSTQFIPVDFDYSNLIPTNNTTKQNDTCIEMWERRCPTHGGDADSCTDWERYSKWTLTSRGCTGGGGSGGGDGTPPTPGTGDSGGGGGSGSGGDDTPCSGIKANAPCEGDNDDGEIITGPVLLDPESEPYQVANFKYPKYI